MVISNGMKFCGLGIFALTAVAFSACGSSPTPVGGNTGSGAGTSSGALSTGSGLGGSPGSSASTAGFGGTPGAGTPASSGAGTPASSGAGTAATSSGATTAGCAASDAPPGAAILTSGDDGGLALNGGVTAYPTPGVAPTPTPTTSAAGALTITEDAPASATAEYVGAVVYFSGNSAGTDCVNASTFHGVEFSISGSISGCTVQFSINDSEHAAMSTTDPKAGGAAGSYPASLALNITAAAQMIQVPFAGTGAPASGMPATAIDPTKLEGVQWQFNIPAAGTAPCTSTLTIDNLSFY